MLPVEGTLRKLSMAAAPPGVTDEEICEDSEDEEDEKKVPPPTPCQEPKAPEEEVDTVTVVAGKQRDQLPMPVPELAITTDEDEVSPETTSTSAAAGATSPGASTVTTAGAGAGTGATAKPNRRRRGPRRRSRQKDSGQTVPQQMTFIVPGGDVESDDGQPAPGPAPRRRLEPSAGRRTRQTPSPGRSPELTAVRRRLHCWPESHQGLEELCGLPTDEEYLSGGEDPAVGRLGAATVAAGVSIDAAAAPFFARLEDLTGRVSSLQTCRDPDAELRELVEAARRESVTLQAAQRPPITDGTDIDSDSTGSEEWDLGTALATDSPLYRARILVGIRVRRLMIPMFQTKRDGVFTRLYVD